VQPVAGIGDAGRREGSAQKTGIIDPGYKSSAPRVEEKAATLDPEKIWQQVLSRISSKSFLRTLTDLVRPIGVEGRYFLLGHSPNDKGQIELTSPKYRQQLETLLNEASGRDWSVKFVAKDGILPSTADAAKQAESFKDDPLIQQAIELFNAEIKS
jgi:hypothetical protein